MQSNEVYVSTDLNDETMWRDEIKLEDMHWIGEAPKEAVCSVRIRHRAPLIEATIAGSTLKLSQPQRAVTAGQSVVIYRDGVCLGGGIVVE